MLYIFGVNIPNDKKVYIALTAIYGIGHKRALDICNMIGLNHNYKVNELTDSQISRMSKIIERNYLIESELRKNEDSNIKRLIQIGSYRGIRHVSGLPVRGQRTHTNAQTKRTLSRKYNIKK